MSFLNTLKELANVALEAVKENPVAAAAIGGGVLVVGAGGVYTKRRLAARKIAKATPAGPVAAVEGIAPVAASEEAPAAPAEPTLLTPEFQQPDRPTGAGKL